MLNELPMCPGRVSAQSLPPSSRAVQLWVGGGGGGRDDLAQGGGSNPEAIEDALNDVNSQIQEL